MTALQPGLIRAILFDLDGTLADTDNVIIRNVARRLRPIHWAFPRRDPIPLLRWGLMLAESPMNWALTVPDVLGIDHQIASAINWLRGGESDPHELEPIPGVGAMLARLHGRYPMAVVSTRDALTTHHFLDTFGFEPYFDAVITSLSADRIKPHPAPVLAAAAALGVPPEACVMVGDTTMDVLAGRRAGAQTVGVLCGFGEQAELERAGANLVLTTTAELDAHLLPGTPQPRAASDLD